MFEFAEFYFTLEALCLKDPGDIGTLADLHNQRIVDLTKDGRAARRRGLQTERLLKAMFTADVRPRMEHIWRERPGSLDQSNLARFLVMQMTYETARRLTIDCVAAGFLTRTMHPFKVQVVTSTGIMETVFARCMLDMQRAIAKLAPDSVPSQSAEV